ncbi:ribonuclease P protein component [Actinomycetaceae bacterium TAE3-ERU4]|nr:ribonuclease P protein component [Actinomycetaceae bacterium TAE3-ERU4]
MVNPADFTATFRRGATVATPRIVLHVQADKGQSTPALVGFVVPKKAIPLATGRNLVKRRLRHAMAHHLSGLDSGTKVVVRAQAAAKEATYGQLLDDLEKSLPRAQAKFARKNTLNGECA